jgi:cytochrome oxidase Cu insertion factor (SCO1/SenC/PrrC family)
VTSVPVRVSNAMAGARRFRITLIVALVVLSAAGAFVAYKMRLPKPQGTFADGQPAPEFTLNDQDGLAFRLSDQRGSGLLLVLYRGYW